MNNSQFNNIKVESEIGDLKRIVVHYPDDGVSSFPPRSMKDILYDDIVDQENMLYEYSHYLEILYWFVDPQIITKNADLLDTVDRLALFTPGNDLYLKSEKVMDVESMLSQIVSDSKVRSRIVSAIGAVERLSLSTQDRLLELNSSALAKTLITGIVDIIDEKNSTTSQVQIFLPLPNQIFTRDTTVVLGENIFIAKPSERARFRERLIAGYLAKFFLLPYEEANHRIIDLEASGPRGYPCPDERLTIEGGDMMMISPRHLIVGLSHRTNLEAVESLISNTFSRGLLDKISVVKIPSKRDYMHIDTVFTQLRRDLWVLFGPFSKMGYERERKNRITQDITREQEILPVSIFQYQRKGPQVDGQTYVVEMKEFMFLEDLLSDITVNEFDSKTPAKFVYSAGGEPLYEEREQWTDSCNFLALREGVIVGYDRNRLTTAALQREGFEVISAEKLNGRFREAALSGKNIDEVISGDTLILLSSHELSRARGGAHCMSQPIYRDPV